MSSAAAALATTDSANSDPVVTSFKAPLLDRSLEEADPETRQLVLDLGAPSQALLDRLSESFPCRVEIADLVANRGVERLNELVASEDEGPDPTAEVLSLLPQANGEPLNAVLCWDLPNYLSLPALTLLVGTIAQRAAPGCKLHMLIAYSRREMPAAPATYRIGDQSQLIQTCRDDALSSAPRYSPEDLGLAVGRFEYERGVLLANGMQEFVYAWRP